MNLKNYKKRTYKYKKFHPSESMFYAWLDKNIDRFNNKPIAIGSHDFRLDGIIKNIILHLDFYNDEVMTPEALFSISDENDMHYDLIDIEYIGEEQYHPLKGYYDADRVDGVYK